DAFGAAVLPGIIKQHYPGECEIAASTCELLEGPMAAGAPGGQAQFHDQFVLLQTGGQWPDEKLARRNCSLSVPANDKDFRPTCECNSRQLGCGICVCQAPSHGPAVADLIVR